MYHILRYIKTYMKDIHTLMLPDYLCSSIITTALKVDFELVFYPLSDSFQLNYVKFPSIYRKNSVVLLINYFGLVSLSEQVSYLRGIDNEICIIEDNVQSFFPCGILPKVTLFLRVFVRLYLYRMVAG